MPKLKLGPIPDEKPVKLTLEIPADLHRDLTTYAEILARENPGSSSNSKNDPKRLIVPMLQHFIANDREFAKAKRGVERNEVEARGSLKRNR